MKKLYKKPEIRKPTKRRLERIVASLIDEANKLESISLIDPLTEALNFRAYDKRLDEEVEKTKRIPNYTFCYIEIDVDNFKMINDKYKHTAGDYVLKEIARLLRENVRLDDAVYRKGGDEFAIICSGQEYEETLTLGDRIANIVNQHDFVYEGQKLVVSVSYGVSEFKGSVKEMKDKADEKMYNRKREKPKGGKDL